MPSCHQPWFEKRNFSIFFSYFLHETLHLAIVGRLNSGPARLLDRAFQSRNNILQPALVASSESSERSVRARCLSEIGAGPSKAKGFWGIDFLANTLY